MIDQPEFFIPQEKIFGQTILTASLDDISNHPNKSVYLSGFPYDEGTVRNGGRIGGAMASTIFRRYLKQRKIYLHRQLSIYDFGDITPEQQLQVAHIDLYKKHLQILQKIKQRESVIVSIGGSNDQSYCNARALMETFPNKKIGVINLDAHFDVRPLKEGKSHSGSPFRQILQNQLFAKNKSHLIQFAVKGANCSYQHFKYLQQKKCEVFWLQKNIRTVQVPSDSKFKTQAGYLFNKIITKLQEQVDIIFVSFDVDSISSKFMPGVSAPSVIGGLSSNEAVQILNSSGICKKVKLVDFSQFNPSVQSIISSTTLIQMFYTFCKHYSYR